MSIFVKSFIASIFVLASSAVAQQRTPVKGKVVSDFDDLEGMYVINKTTEASVYTTRGGYFTINAAVNDTLIFTAVQFTAKKVAVTEKDITADGLMLVPVEPLQHELSELIINDYSYINSVALGLVPAGQKKYTPGERKLAAAESFRLNPMGLDPVFNAFSGRTAMLKKAAEAEKKENLMEKINYLYTEEYIVSKLNIPIDYVRGFVFYVVENKYFTKAISEKNTEMAKFMIVGLAEKYLSLIKNDQ